MSLKKYEAFARIVELKSLTKAADDLGYTQSCLSHMISSLESELGFSVLVRSRSGISLTAEGELILPVIRKILEEKKHLDRLVASISAEGAGVVRIGAFTSVAVNWLPGILKKYREAHSTVEIRMFNGDYHDVEQWLKQGEIDIGFLALPGPEGIRCEPLKEDDLYVILPADHPLAAYESIPVELVAQEPIISLLETSSQDLRRAFGNVRPDIRYITKDDYAIIAMVQAGLGISIMPELLLTHNDSDVAVRPLVPPVSRTLAIGYSPAAQDNPAVSSFISCVKEWVFQNT